MDDSVYDKVLSIELPEVNEPWRSGSISIGLSDNLLNGKIELYNGTLYQYEGEVQWGHHWESNDKTNRLYLLSLHYVGELLSAYTYTTNENYLRKAKEILKNFIHNYHIKNPELALQSSSDHAHYTRVRVYVKAIQLLRMVPEERDLCKGIIDSLISHLAWMYDDKNHAPNNHGIMTNFGIIIASAQLSPMEENVNKWLTKAYARLTKLIRTTFDEDGMNNENTIGYHKFNISLYRQVVNFSQQNNMGEDFIKLAEPIIKNAAVALQYIIWQDGQIPPIGDSPVMASGVKSINKIKWFKKSNFAVIKDNNLYLTIKCGFTTSTHKHVDESSITIRYGGKDIIIDSGSYSYDREHPYRIYMESARGHSGIYPSFLDGVRSINYCKEHHQSSRIDVLEERDGTIYVRCFYGLKKEKFWALREIYIDMKKYRIQVVDTYSSEMPTEVRQQYIFHPDATIEKMGDSTFHCQNGDVVFNISNSSSQASDLYRGEDTPLVRGWYSSTYQEKKPTFGLDFLEKGTYGRFNTTVSIGPQDLSKDVPAPSLPEDEKTKVLIFGSCVTRDIFRVDGNNVTISDYFARQSIASSVTEPCAVDSKNIALESNFQKRMVKRDFDKSFWKTLKEVAFDFLLIDLIDERFNLLQIGDSKITKSSEFAKSGLSKKMGPFEEISRSQYSDEQWAIDCKRFCELLLENVEINKIILVKAFWAQKYLNGEGSVVPFDDSTNFKAETINNANQRLEYYYDYLVSNLPGVRIVEIKEPVADMQHIWGLSPFHYEEKRYRQCRMELNQIFQGIVSDQTRTEARGF